jgi:hypothetical protein
LKPYFTIANKLACLERELKMRRRVYPRWITQGKMDASKAAHEIECMEAIVIDYRVLAKQEELPLT